MNETALPTHARNGFLPLLLAVSVAFVSACGDSADAAPAPAPDPRAVVGPPKDDDAVYASARRLEVDVPPKGRVYLRLSDPAVVEVLDPTADNGWDLALEGYDVYTNGGASGKGAGAAFGPLDVQDFLGTHAPAVPFLLQDKPGGAFFDWYAYDAESHALWSRYHVVGLRDGQRLWKVQVLGYYGVRDGATVPALYRIRVADLTSGGATTEIGDLDGTAGGAGGAEDQPAACLDLGTGERRLLTSTQAASSNDWHLCFRRASIRVNGGAGGPRGVVGVDLDQATTAGETLASVQKRTAASELAHFDQCTRDSFSGMAFHGDRIVSAFTDLWVDESASPPAPRPGAYLVTDASGKKKFLVAFPSFQNPTAVSPGKVVVRIKSLEG